MPRLLTVQILRQTWFLACLILLLTMLTVRIVTLLFTKSVFPDKRAIQKENVEINTFAFAIFGLVAEKDFQTKATPVDFFYAKGIVEALFDKLESFG